MGELTIKKICKETVAWCLFVFNGTDTVQVIQQRAEQLPDPLKQGHHMQDSTCNSTASLTALAQRAELLLDPLSMFFACYSLKFTFKKYYWLNS